MEGSRHLERTYREEDVFVARKIKALVISPKKGLEE